MWTLFGLSDCIPTRRHRCVGAEVYDPLAPFYRL